MMPPVRCVRTIQPRRGDSQLTAELCRDARGALGVNEAIVVELGWRDFETEAASVLAWYLVDGHPLTIRGKRHEVALLQLVEALARQHTASLAGQP